MNMAALTYRKATWRAEVGAEELATGKFQGMVRLFHDDEPLKPREIHRTVDVFDSTEGAVEEGAVLAQHILGNL
jgi:hypothetical protein